MEDQIQMYSDNPDRDSLDGNVPSSSPGTNPAGSPTTATTAAPGGPSSSTAVAAGSSAGGVGGGGGGMFGRRSKAVARSGRGQRSEDAADDKERGGSRGSGGGDGEAAAGSASDVEQGGCGTAIVWRETEPCTEMWSALSSMYGRLVVLISVAFCVTEMTDTTIMPLTYQGTFMMYLYVVSIVTILGIYGSVIADSLHTVTSSKQNLTASGDPDLISLASFGTLKRAHISPANVSRSSFYLRVGALVFGVGTLVFNGLEIAMHITSGTGDCSGQMAFAHPILQAIFTFLQMHFMFVNSEVVVEKFGTLARFGLIHLMATNLSVWFRIIIWDSAHDWIHFARAYLARTARGFGGSNDPLALKLQGFPGLEDLGYNGYIDLEQATESNKDGSIGLRDSGVLFYGDPYGSTATPCNNSSLFPIAVSHVQRVERLYQCYNNNTLGQMWTQTMPYLLPFVVEYSLIASVVTYIMWTKVGGDKSKSKPTKRLPVMNGTLDVKRTSPWRTDCRSVSKGLFLGLLCLVGGVVVLIIFFVMKDTNEFRDRMFWMACGTQLIVLFLSVSMSIIGFFQISKLSLRKNLTDNPMDSLLSSVTIFGVYLIGIFGMIVGGFRIGEPRHMTLFVMNTLLIIQATMQCMLVAEARQRFCQDRQQQTFKPGRQVITFLLFANITLWMLDTLMAHHWLSHEMQFSYYGFLTWGVISRVGLPLMIFFRFHQAVILIGIWKKTYKTRMD